MTDRNDGFFPYCEPETRDEFQVFAGITRKVYEPYKGSKQYAAAVSAVLERLLQDPKLELETFDGVLSKVDAKNNALLEEERKLNEVTKSKGPRLNVNDRGGDDLDEEDDAESVGEGELLTEEQILELEKKEQAEKAREEQLLEEQQLREEEEAERLRENEEKLAAQARHSVDHDISKDTNFQQLKRDDDEDAWSMPAKGKGKGKKGKR